MIMSISATLVNLIAISILGDCKDPKEFYQARFFHPTFYTGHTTGFHIILNSVYIGALLQRQGKR